MDWLRQWLWRVVVRLDISILVKFIAVIEIVSPLSFFAVVAPLQKLRTDLMAIIGSAIKPILLKKQQELRCLAALYVLIEAIEGNSGLRHCTGIRLCQHLVQSRIPDEDRSAGKGNGRVRINHPNQVR